MQERHPIDDLFRRGLQGASVAPPPALASAIMAKVQGRRRRALLWRWRLVAALLLLVGGTLLWLKPTGEASSVADGQGKQSEAAPTTTVSPAETKPSVAHEYATSETPKQLEPNREANTPRTDGASPHVKPPARNKQSEGTGQVGGAGINAQKMSASGIGSASTSLSANDHEPISVGSSEVPSESSAPNIAIDRMSLERLSIAPVLWAGAGSAQPHARYFERQRRRGYWWAGVSVAPQFSRYSWRSDQGKLEQALNGNGKLIGGVSLSAHAGRTWPSGISLALGVEADRMEQAYSSVDRRTEVQSETVVQLVTLNTQVFATNIETVNTTVVQEARAEGKDSRTRVRVPVELSYHLASGRWRLGPRAAAVMEYTRIRSSSSLVVDSEDGLIRSRPLTQPEQDARYPLSLSALLGIDLGFNLSDNSRIIVSPFASRALATFGPATDAKASPERYGLRFLLQHRF
ncbi:MAG TPA: hypothetical protein PKY96_04250 [Flavobacteriales bacterium]|nr:hypothetical protein [Flavobacteriales bacterium]